jgi:hypothetical protein
VKNYLWLLICYVALYQHIKGMEELGGTLGA